MRGEVSSGRFDKRHPYDWYVDEIWCARQLIAALGDLRAEARAGLSIWDPAAGLGNTIQAAWEIGHDCHLSDIVENVDWPGFEIDSLCPPTFASADFLEIEAAPVPCSIICNPPYSYRKVQGVLISELVARHALKLSSRRVCLLLPTKWLSSQARYRLFTEHPPLAVLHLTQRPSMPPGDRIAAMGARAFRGGMVDYCWIVWDVTRATRPGETRTVWLPPLAAKIEPIEGLA
jgi:hypothetical protein